MTDRERLLGLINGDPRIESIEAIFNYFFDVYADKISIRTMHNLMNSINAHLGRKVDNLERARFIANERARYIKQYLEGKMWPSEELAKQHLQPQIDNAQAIIDACKR